MKYVKLYGIIAAKGCDSMDQVKPALIKLSPEEIDKRFNNDNKNKSIPCQSETNNQTDLPQNAPYNPVQPNAMGNVTQYQYDQRYYASNPNSAMPPQNLSYNSILPNATENIRIDQYNQQLYSPQPDSVSLPQTSTSAENPVSVSCTGETGFPSAVDVWGSETESGCGEYNC